jgi:hypothetical protein
VLLVFATGAFLVRTVMLQRTGSGERAKQQAFVQPNEAPKPPVVETTSTPETPKQDSVAVSNVPPQKYNADRPKQVAIKIPRQMATVDSSFTGAEVIKGNEPLASSAAIPIDASSLQSFRVLVDDGRGNAKTISVPTISFGSQRLMQNANQFAPKRVW